MVLTRGITDVPAEVTLRLNLSAIWQQKAAGHSEGTACIKAWGEGAGENKVKKVSGS